MNANVCRQLKTAIEIGLNAEVNFEVLESTIRLCADLHGEAAAFSDLVSILKQQVGKIQSCLRQAEECLADSESSQNPSAGFRAKELEPLRDSLVDVNEILPILVDVQSAECPDTKDAGVKLVALARRKVLAVVDAINDALS